MRKKIVDDYPTKSRKRQQKKRLRMAMHGRSLKLGSRFAGKKLASR